MFKELKIRRNLTKEKRVERSKAISKAVHVAMRSYFTGDGQSQRIMSFISHGFLKSLTCMAMLLGVISWCIVGAFGIGPGHASLLAEVHTWAQSASFNDVLSVVHSRVVELLVIGMKGGILLGYTWQLVSIIDPAAQDARVKFDQTSAV